MKKIGVVFLILFFIFPIISALEINMDSQIPQGKTIIASIQGNFLDSITSSNIEFYRGYVRTSFDSKVAKIGDTYYIYFQSAGKYPNNYSMNITGVRYWEGSQISNQQISKNFIITNEIADFSISNGFVITSDNFSLKLQNLKEENIEINIDEEFILGSSEDSFTFEYGGQEVENSINLNSGQIKYLEIKINEISETTVRKITLSTSNLEYKIPVYLILNGSSYINNTNTSTNETPINTTNQTTNITNETQTNTTNQTTSTNCTWFTKLFGCEEVNCTDTCSSLKYKCGDRTICGKIVNCGNCSLGFTCQTNGTCTLTPCTDTCSSLKYSCGNRTICGKIVNCGNCSLGFTCQTNGTCTIVSGSFLSKTCAESNGKICSENQTCANNTIKTKDANCCFSNCIEKTENKSKKLIGWLIIIVLGILIFWFFILKFKKTKRTKDTVLGSKNKR
jgi:membrane-bound inhibitor of C-type lysozyme